MFELDAYLARIGLSGRPGVRELHRAHTAAIPFENLDPQRGVVVSLALEDLQRKLVEQRRGGYCFEQNLLLKAALEALGAEVELLLARVRLRSAPGVTRPRSHLLLRVRAEGAVWHADVGFGLGTLLEPLPFGPGEAHEQSGWRFRVIADGPEHVLQTVQDGEWIDLYGFPEQAVPLIDVETINWWTCTHPRSPFVTGLIASVNDRDGTRVSLSDWSGLMLSECTPAARVDTPVERELVPALLAERFGLGGFALDAGGRLVLSGA
ncbi:MAG: arylamine N-acetyltransferase [Solirubrobacterales bacterium]|nr:arylamine N-acetyltransferase [Solirubrobacterales bacterium]